MFATMGSTISRMGFLVRSDLAEGGNEGHSKVAAEEVRKIGSTASVSPSWATLVGDHATAERSDVSFRCSLSLWRFVVDMMMMGDVMWGDADANSKMTQQTMKSQMRAQKYMILSLPFQVSL